MDLKPSGKLQAKLEQKPLKGVEVKRPTLKEHKDSVQRWIDANKTWVELLARLAEHPRGFSFTEADPANYAADPDYKAQWDEHVKGLPSFLEMGATFAEAVATSPFDLEMTRELLIFSEEKGHLPHTAAVLWMEHVDAAYKDRQWAQYKDKNGKSHPLMEARIVADAARGKNGQPPKLRDYEECLKRAYLSELEKLHPEWVEKPVRREAMFKYLVGASSEQSSPLPSDHKDLQARRELSHLTLGKVHIRRETQAHQEPKLIRAHPGFWGLFSLSPFYRDDRGMFVADKSDLAWVNFATDPNGPLRMEKKNLSHFAGKNEFQVYEKVPRLFADAAQTKPGVYLHRSKAHGRDDFLVAVAGAQASDRRCMVFCTKGVGADKDLVPFTTAGQRTGFQGRFGAKDAASPNWESPQNAAQRSQFAFAYAPLDTDMEAGSWRNAGFCLQWGARNIKERNGAEREMVVEVASVDFRNLEMMHWRAITHRLNTITRGFVEPYAVIEISRLRRNRARMPAVTRGVDAGEIGYPVQIVTLSPIETSLRLNKASGDAESYDYNNIELEVRELQRVYAKGEPLSDATLKAIDADVAALTSWHTEVASMTKASDAEKQLIPPAMARVKERMQLAMKIMRNVVASYLVFLNNGCSSDSYTSSFAGVNFASGPRDPNDWNLLILESDKPPFGPRAEVDIQDMKGLLSMDRPTFLTSLGLARLEGDDLYLTDKDKGRWVRDNLNYMAYQSHVAECLSSASMLLRQVLNSARTELDVLKNEPAYATKRDDDEELNAEYAKRLYARYQTALASLESTDKIKINKDWLLALFQ